MVFFVWKLWLEKVDGMENLPTKGPAIIISNHASFYDFFVLASVLEKQTVFVAVKNLNQKNFVGWFMKLDTIVYIDREKPGYSFFKTLMRHLHANKIIVIYPEGTRSRSGHMLIPKLGFVKLALKSNAPIIPIAMCGTYEILPPHKHFPKFKKCSIKVGGKHYVSPSNPLLKDIFFRQKIDKKFSRLTEDELEEIGFRLMNQVRLLSGQQWDDSAKEKVSQYDLLNNLMN